MTNHWSKPRSISVVVDNESWIIPYAERLTELISQGGDDARFLWKYEDIPCGNIVFLLGCTRIAPADILERNRYNLVVHESDLPKGRGFAPLTWAILNGERKVKACLIEASKGSVDSGKIFCSRDMTFEDFELNVEIRKKQGETTIALCLDFLNSPHPPKGVKQVGEPSFFTRRRPADSRLNPYSSIAEQFDLLRVVDNVRYPAFFDIRGHRYFLRIESGGKVDEGGEN